MVGSRFGVDLGPTSRHEFLMGAMLNEQWAGFLTNAGGSMEAGEIRSFRGDTGLHHARSGCFVCDLSGYALAAFVGLDAEAFLHGQLSNDVKALSHDQSQVAAYNTPKGRILATMLLWRNADGFLAQLPGAIAPGILKRLSMFILRSKVKATDASDRYVRFGLGGPTAAQIASAAGVLVTTGDFKVLGSHGGEHPVQPDFVLGLPSGRFEFLYSDVQAAMACWNALCARGAKPAGMAPWHWLSVQSGIAEICPETQDKFVPQMLNLELVGGVSFNKGCYPGQEIVARTQYRGEIKRRTVLAHVDSKPVPAVGEDVINAESPEQSIGSLVAVAPSPTGGYDALACLHMDLARDGELHLGEAHGPRLHLKDLPYKLPSLSKPCA